jgi:hypothetical protein
MNFGLYLVKNGIINEETYLNALEEQYSSLPSMIEVLRKKCQVSDAKVLEIVQKQSANSSSFLEAARDVLDEGTLQEAIDAQNQSIKTIGEILVNNNLVDLVKIQEQVESYVSQPATSFEETQSTPETAAPVQEAAPASSDSDEAEVSQAAIDSMKEIFGNDSPEVKEMEAKLAAAQAGASAAQVQESSPAPVAKSTTAPAFDQSFFKAEHELDQDLVPELILKFNAKEIVELSKGIKELATAEDKQAAIDNLNKRLHTILRAAKLSGAKILAESVKTLENYTKTLTPESLDETTTDKVYQFFSLLVKLRNHIEQEKSEKGFFDNSGRQNSYESLRVTLL